MAEVIVMSHKSAYFQLNNVGGLHNIKEIKRELDKLDGVTSVSVNASKNMVAVDYDNTGVQFSQISGSLEKLGYSAQTQQMGGEG